MKDDPLPENEFIPVAFDYKGYELERIWNAILCVKADSKNANQFAKKIRDYYLGRYSGTRAPRRGGGKKLTIRVLGEKQLSEYYKRQDNRKIPDIQIETWRFLDVVSELIRREKQFQLDSSIFNYFNFDAVPVDHSIMKSGLTFYVRPLSGGNTARSGVFIIEGAEDEFHTRVTLWISKAENVNDEIARRDILEENYRFLSRWDGLARFILPAGRTSNYDRIFADHDVEVILQECRRKTPGSLSIGNRNLSKSPNAAPICLFRSPHGEVSYEFERIELGGQR